MRIHFSNINKVGMLIANLRKSQHNDGDNLQQQNSSPLQQQNSSWKATTAHTILTNLTVLISTPQH